MTDLKQPSSGPVAPFPPEKGTIDVAKPAQPPTVSPEEAHWTDEERGHPGPIRAIMRRLDRIFASQMRGGGDLRREAKIARNLEPEDWHTYEVQVPAGAKSQSILPSVANRRDLLILNTSAYTINVSPLRSTGGGSLGFPVAPGGSLTMRTRGAVYACAPTAPALSSTSQGAVVVIQVAEELY